MNFLSDTEDNLFCYLSRIDTFKEGVVGQAIKNENITLSNNLIAINEETRINPNSIQSSVPIIRAIIPDKIHARLKLTTTIAVHALSRPLFHLRIMSYPVN